MTQAKLIAYAVAAIALLAIGWYFGSLHSKTVLEASQAATLKSLANAWQARELQTQTATDRYVNEIETLHVTRSQPLPGVALRVCFNNPILSSLTSKDHVTPTGPLPSGDASVPQPSGDIRPGLFALADEADEVVATCRRTQ